MNFLIIASILVVATFIIGIFAFAMLQLQEMWGLSKIRTIMIAIGIGVVVIAIFVLDYAIKSSLVAHGAPWWYVWLN